MENIDNIFESERKEIAKILWKIHIFERFQETKNLVEKYRNIAILRTERLEKLQELKERQTCQNKNS